MPGLALTRQGLKRWFFVTADYPFGRELQAHGTHAIESAGGTVVGSVKNPHGENDFSPFLQAARDSKAEVLGLANGHAELLKAMAAMEKMNLTGRMKLVGLLTFIDDVHEMDLRKRRIFTLPTAGFGRATQKAANGRNASTPVKIVCPPPCRRQIIPQPCST